jgi:hypothetical protein
MRFERYSEKRTEKDRFSNISGGKSERQLLPAVEWRRAIDAVPAAMTGVSCLVRAEDGDGFGVVDGVLLTAMLTRKSDVVALCHVVWIVCTRLVFAAFHPGASGTTPWDRRLARVKDAIARLLDVFEELRMDAALGSVPVREMDRLRLVNA